MPLVQIDRQQIEVAEGTTIMQAADELGIFIPRYCYHPGLSIAGCCRSGRIASRANDIHDPEFLCNRVTSYLHLPRLKSISTHSHVNAVQRS